MSWRTWPVSFPEQALRSQDAKLNFLLARYLSVLANLAVRPQVGVVRLHDEFDPGCCDDSIAPLNQSAFKGPLLRSQTPSRRIGLSPAPVRLGAGERRGAVTSLSGAGITALSEGESMLRAAVQTTLRVHDLDVRLDERAVCRPNNKELAASGKHLLFRLLYRQLGRSELRGWRA